jgi:chromosomal replication initiation ATPase DnaA
MPRQARIDTPGALHHVICRGIERRNIFRDNTDRNRFLERLGAEGWTLTKIAERVAEIFDIEKDHVVVAGKQSDRVRARGVLAYWAIRDLGLTATEVGTYLGLSKSAVSRAATRGQKLIVDQSLPLKD